MKNRFAGKCQHCRVPVAAGAGELIDCRGDLILYCAEHPDMAFSEATRFARQLPPAPDAQQPIERTFDDGSVARWNVTHWWGSS